MNISVILLAAGAGTRMRSHLPKVVPPLAGKPLIGHILETLNKIPSIEQCCVITGHERARVESFCEANKHDLTIQPVYQSEQLGTAHAVKQAIPYLPDEGVSLVLYADVPLLKVSTLEKLIALLKDHDLALLTQELDNPFGYGRILRDQTGVKSIVEEKDATDDERLITEVNTGILALPNRLLKHYLPLIDNNNQQREYYLTDLVGLMSQDSLGIETLQPESAMEVQGVNDKAQLATLERAFQYYQAEKLLHQGVTLADPLRFDLRGQLNVGKDVFIDVNCVFQGEVVLGNHVSIGPNCIIGEIGKTVIIEDYVEIKANSIVEAAEIGESSMIGPYARIRPDSKFAAHVKIGNFVETKKTSLGAGSKVNHLSYVGDAVIGEQVNIGAGTITCNYDGVNKFQTTIENGAFIGSNTSLVAPVTVAKNAVVGAGSTITREVKDNQLAIARGKQRNIDNWPKPEKK